MSLNQRQLAQTRLEMAKNFEELNQSSEEIKRDLGFSSLDLKNALEVVPRYNPTNVWKLRDYLEEKIYEQGKTFYPFSVLQTNYYYPYEKNWSSH